MDTELVILWPWTNPDGSTPLTISSRIVAIEEDEQIVTSSTSVPEDT